MSSRRPAYAQAHVYALSIKRPIVKLSCFALVPTSSHKTVERNTVRAEIYLHI